MKRPSYQHNVEAWNRQVEQGNRWSIPVGPEEVASARRGEWRLLLTPTRCVPAAWYPPLAGADVLALASGGGQQGPLLAAAGAHVVVLDASPRQLEQDRRVAAREGLEVRTEEGDMADLSRFRDGSFDLVFHPVSNCFAAEVRPVWRECFRVLRPGGVLLAGFANPLLYLFEDDPEEGMGELVVTHRIPYSDAERRSQDEKREWAEKGYALEFGHSLEDQIGGQLEAGFVLTGMYEDRPPVEESPLSRYIATFIATRAFRA